MKLAAAYLRGVSFSRRAPSGWPRGPSPPGPSGLPRGHSTGRKPHLVTPVFLRAEAHLGRLAVVDQHGRFTYDDLLHYSSLLSKKIGDLCCRSRGEDRDIDGARVAFLCGNDVSYVVAKWAVWMAGGVAVPLSRAHPPGDLEYLVEDSRSSVVVAAEELKDLVRGAADRLQLPLVVLSETDYTADYDGSQNSWFRTSPVTAAARGRRPKRAKNRFDDLLVTNRFKHRGALIVYTSGTTGRPKGVLLTHGNLHAQVEAMVVAWGWSRNDVILHVLPLHHIHGIVNVLMTPLHCGATCVMLPKFEPKKVWSALLNPVNMEDRLRINLFMAVPTIYAKLIENIEAHLKRGRGSRYAKAYVKSACQSRIRLMVSGSSSLPQPVMERWEDITGHRLLERYGMTEIGMALTNPLKGQRTPGAVGNPMPWMEVCIARPNVYAPNGYDVITKGSMRGTSVTPGLEGEQGELMVRGPSVFKEYWNKPEATKAAFTKDGWFKTGDTVLYEDGIYKIMGRTSVDIIKSGGYKISALNIERHLLAHPLITDCAVVGLSDITWGQRVAAAVVLKGGSQLSLEQLRRWAQERLPSYQLPTVLKCLNTLPRNAMGKVNKEDILAEVFPEFLRSLI